MHIPVWGKALQHSHHFTNHCLVETLNVLCVTYFSLTEVSLCAVASHSSMTFYLLGRGERGGGGLQGHTTSEPNKLL